MNFRTLDLNLLRVFDEVMAEKSLTRAADQLAMTQPAVSNAMRRLRELVGDDLVVRAGYGVEPTPRAIALWPAVRGALAGLRESLAPEPFDPRTTYQSFMLSMADSTAALLLPPILREIETLHSKITLRVVPLTTRDPRKLLEANAADLAIGYFPNAVATINSAGDTGTNFLHARIYNGRYVCVMRKQNPRARQWKKKPMTLDEYCAADHLLVSFSGRPFGLIDGALAAINRKRRIVLTVNQFFTAGKLVAGSDLLSVLPEHFLASTGMMDELVAFDLPFAVEPVHVDMLWHRSLEANSAQRWLRGAVERAGRTAFAR